MWNWLRKIFKGKPAHFQSSLPLSRATAARVGAQTVAGLGGMPIPLSRRYRCEDEDPTPALIIGGIDFNDNQPAAVDSPAPPTDFQGFQGGESGGAGASGSWDAPADPAPADNNSCCDSSSPCDSPSDNSPSGDS